MLEGVLDAPELELARFVVLARRHLEQVGLEGLVLGLKEVEAVGLVVGDLVLPEAVEELRVHFPEALVLREELLRLREGKVGDEPVFEAEIGLRVLADVRYVEPVRRLDEQQVGFQVVGPERDDPDRFIDIGEVLEVKELFASPFNSCDLVTVAGANGAIIEALAESAKNSTADAVVENEKGRKSHNMEIDELATKVDALVESVSALTGTVTTLVEASKPAPVETSDEEPAATADVADAIEKAVDAGLPKEVRQEIKESLERDPSIDVDKLIEKKKAFLDDLRESLAEDAGYVHESASGKSSATDFIPAGWKR